MGHFQWVVAREGYVWCEAHPIREGQLSATSERFLTPGFTLVWKPYQPFKDTPALFRIFADVAPTEESIVAFANQYGILGLGELIAFEDGNGGHGERLAVWHAEILAMQHAIRVWEALQDHAQETLQRWFTLEEHGTFANIRYRPDTPFPLGVPHTSVQFVDDQQAETVMLSLPPRWQLDLYVVEPSIPRDAGGLAFAWLRSQLNEHLTRDAAPYIGYVDGSEAEIPLALQTMPKNLCGALWLQLAMAIRGPERQQQCPQCGQWFLVPAKARRPSTTYCSTRCRIRAARQRQASAKQDI